MTQIERGKQLSPKTLRVPFGAFAPYPMKAVKFILYALGAFVGVLLLGAAGVYVVSSAKLHRKFVVHVAPEPIPTGPVAVALGRHLAQTRGCMDCHGQDLGGGVVFHSVPMGLVAAPNLTRGRGGVGGTFTDQDFIRAIRRGVAKSGRGLFLMPSTEYATLTTDDLGALIAYIRSVPPVDRPTQPVALGPVARLLVAIGQIRLAADVLKNEHPRPADIAPAPTAAYGRYLATGCTECHGDNFSGGRIKVGPPDWPPAANLTPGPGGRITTWTEADFVQALRTGKRPDGTVINPVMPRAFGKLDDVELKALYAFLKTLPAAPTGSHL